MPAAATATATQQTGRATTKQHATCNCQVSDKSCCLCSEATSCLVLSLLFTFDFDASVTLHTHTHTQSHIETTFHTLWALTYYSIVNVATSLRRQCVSVGIYIYMCVLVSGVDGFLILNLSANCLLSVLTLPQTVRERKLRARIQ